MNSSIVLHVGVKIFLRNSAGKYLLLRRSKIRYPNIKNCWDIPGGRIVFGTTLFENLKREVLEETKLRIVGEPRLLSAQDIINRKNHKHIVRITYIARANGKSILNEEHIESAWCTIEEMKKNPRLDEFTREVIENNF